MLGLNLTQASPVSPVDPVPVDTSDVANKAPAPPTTVPVAQAMLTRFLNDGMRASVAKPVTDITLSLPRVRKDDQKLQGGQATKQFFERFPKVRYVLY